MKDITKDDVESCWDYPMEYLVDILNGDYNADDAYVDLKGLIGTKWDRRTNDE